LKTKRISDYEKFKAFHRFIRKRITQIEENMQTWTTPKNPRQDVRQHTDKHNLTKLYQQEQHIKERLQAMEKIIEDDIIQFKNA
jgi:hypothetical protein